MFVPFIASRLRSLAALGLIALTSAGGVTLQPVLDVSPDGTAANVMSPGLNVQRASYRDLSKGRQLLESGRTYAIDLDHLITSNVFARGHRVRAQISASFFPNFSSNLQTGELEQRSSEGRRATIRVYHDRTHASRITLPVVVH